MTTVQDEREACEELVLIAERLQQSATCAAVGLAFAQPGGDGVSVVPAGTEQHLVNVRDTLACLADYAEAFGA
jgi:hypothetical protein